MELVDKEESTAAQLKDGKTHFQIVMKNHG